MPPLRILVNGAGVCGPALACYLLGSDLDVAITIVERSAELRTAGQQIDLRDQGIPLMRRLGVLDTIKQRVVHEKALSFVNAAGETQASFGVNDSGKGPQSFVSEYEIMRGDLVAVLYEHSLELAERTTDKDRKSLKYEFGKYATEIVQSGTSTAAVTFSDGTQGTFDLVVAADGQGSKTRRLIWGVEASNKALDSKDLFIGLWNFPKSDWDKKRKEAFVYNCPGRRLVSLRTAADVGAQACIGIMGRTQELRNVQTRPVEEQKKLWDSMFRGCGWQTDRLLESMHAADDFYMSEIVQVKTSEWSKGRVVLLGDAGYCPSPITGLGTTVSLMGAYTLAGSLAQHPGDVDTALRSYEEELRPFVTGAQKLAPGVPGLLYPSSAFGVGVLRWLAWTVWVLKLDKFIGALTPETAEDVKTPEYAALNLPPQQKTSERKQ
ncbi:FAD-dependent urate hydroxylase [Microdochium nivale]|nr:FAD-dependent urate hydroxylase [Microdochium nivale]